MFFGTGKRINCEWTEGMTENRDEEMVGLLRPNLCWLAAIVIGRMGHMAASRHLAIGNTPVIYLYG